MKNLGELEEIIENLKKAEKKNLREKNWNEEVLAIINTT
jgi:hypothetical protein